MAEIATTTPITTANDVQVDAGLLRKALRLIHCLQRERGASCRIVASSDGSIPNNNNISSAQQLLHFKPLQPARRDTDRAFALLLQSLIPQKSSNLPIEKVTLDKIRRLLSPEYAENSLQDDAYRTTKPINFHHILVCFNTLIQSIIHEYILKYTSSSRLRKATSRIQITDGHQTSVHNDKEPGSVSMMKRSCSHQAMHQPFLEATSSRHHRHKRSLSSDANPLHKFSGNLIVSPSSNSLVDNRKQIYGVSSPSPYALEHKMSSDSDEQMHYCYSSGDETDDTDGEGESDAIHEILAPPPDVDEYDDDDCEDYERLARLLNLLDVLVRLKESTGVERAMLSAILALGMVESQVLSGMVMQVENQRRQISKLSNMLPKSGGWQDLVEEVVVGLSPRMKKLQNNILSGFDLVSLQNTFRSQVDLWNLLTLYIDKLHALELLVVEEIECCVGSDSDPVLATSHCVPSGTPLDSPNNGVAYMESASIINLDWRRAFGMTNDSSFDDLQKQIETMHPDEVKARFLAAIPRSEETEHLPERNFAASSTDAVVAAADCKGVEDLLAELSKVPASKEWEIDLYEIRFLKRIGQGNAGTTYLADWNGLNVAVKVASISEMGLEGWRTEVQALQKLHHPNVIRLLGSVYHAHPLTFCLVLEYCDAGDLSAALRQATPSNFFDKVSEGCAKGMRYLHGRNVIHRDIKPGNVLLEGNVPSGNFNVKVSDFGVATELSCTSDRTAETGTYRWMAPEVIRHERYSQTADVYSFAVVLWQLLTRESPFEGISQVEAASAVALHDARPPFPEGTPSCICNLIGTCWSDDPEKRMSFEQIIAVLNEIRVVLTTEEHEWLTAPMGHQVYKLKDNSSAQEAYNQGAFQKKKKKKKKKGIRNLFNRKSTHF